MTPDLQLRTLYVLDGEGRLAAVREPGSRRPPLFALVRGRDSTAWAIRSDVPEPVATELIALLGDEPPADDLAAEPKHAGRYGSRGRIECGPAFTFPDELAACDAVLLDDPAVAGTAHFPWIAAEFDARSPFAVVVEHGQVVSVCCCARRSAEAAEASLETAVGFRGKGYAPRVTAAWASAVRSSGRIPLYSTAWTNHASRAVAAKLGLQPYAADWSVYD